MLITRVLDPERFTAEELYALMPWPRTTLPAEDRMIETLQVMLSRAVEAGILGTEETPEVVTPLPGGKPMSQDEVRREAGAPPLDSIGE